MQEFNFPNWVNRFFYVALATVVIVGGYLANCLFFAIHPDVVNRGHRPEQPVPFSHKLHAGDLKMDCRYCHNTVDQAGHAAIPPTATCGNCHGGNRTVEGRTLAVVHQTSSLLVPVRESLEATLDGDQSSDKSGIGWLRVHDLPDFVYFNHSAHVNRGVSCVACHGRVDQMLVVEQAKSLSMKFCLDCHRAPEPYLRDPALVTQLDFQISEESPQVIDGKTFVDQEAYGAYWKEKLQIAPNESCSTCHR